MKRTLRKILSSTLVLAMLLTMLPAAMYAAAEGGAYDFAAADLSDWVSKSAQGNDVVIAKPNGVLTISNTTGAWPSAVLDTTGLGLTYASTVWEDIFVFVDIDVVGATTIQLKSGDYDIRLSKFLDDNIAWNGDIETNGNYSAKISLTDIVNAFNNYATDSGTGNAGITDSFTLDSVMVYAVNSGTIVTVNELRIGGEDEPEPSENVIFDLLTHDPSEWVVTSAGFEGAVGSINVSLSDGVLLFENDVTDGWPNAALDISALGIVIPAADLADYTLEFDLDANHASWQGGAANFFLNGSDPEHKFSSLIGPMTPDPDLAKGDGYHGSFTLAQLADLLEITGDLTLNSFVIMSCPGDITIRTFRILGPAGEEPEPTVTVPGAPQNLRVVSAYDGAVTIAWDDPADNGGAAIDFNAVGVDNDCDFAPEWVEMEVAGNQYTFTTDENGDPLVNGTEYEFAICAHNSAGYSATYASILATPVESPDLITVPASAVISFDGSSIEADGVNINRGGGMLVVYTYPYALGANVNATGCTLVVDQDGIVIDKSISGEPAPNEIPLYGGIISAHDLGSGVDNEKYDFLNAIEIGDTVNVSITEPTVTRKVNKTITATDPMNTALSRDSGVDMLVIYNEDVETLTYDYHLIYFVVQYGRVTEVIPNGGSDLIEVPDDSYIIGASRFGSTSYNKLINNLSVGARIIVDAANNSFTVRYPSDVAVLASLAGQTITATGGTGSWFDNDMFLATINVPNSQSTITLDDMVLEDEFAGASLYRIEWNDEGYWDRDLTESISLTAGGATLINIDVVAENGYWYSYLITVNRAKASNPPVIIVGGDTKYTVSFDSQGGSDVASQSITKGNVVDKPADPTRDGYTFDGWYTDAECTLAYDFETAVTASITLYAKWSYKWPADVPSTWAQPQVIEAIANNLVPADLQKDYKLEMNRLNFCRMAIQFLTAVEYDFSKVTPAEAFNDCDDENVLLAAALGIVEGTGHGNFDPTRDIRRDEAACMLARLCEVLGVYDADAEQTEYADQDSIHSWANAPINFMFEINVMTGASESKFDPYGLYTTETAIVTFQRLLDWFLD